MLRRENKACYVTAYSVDVSLCPYNQVSPVFLDQCTVELGSTTTWKTIVVLRTRGAKAGEQPIGGMTPVWQRVYTCMTCAILVYSCMTWMSYHTGVQLNDIEAIYSNLKK